MGAGQVVTLFNLEGARGGVEMWGYSSAGRAPALQAGGRRFDPDYLHQKQLNKKALKSQIKAQRSGFDLKRRKNGAMRDFADSGMLAAEVSGAEFLPTTRARSSAG